VGLIEKHRVYYNGEGAGFPKSGPWWVMWIQVCPWLVLAPKVLQLCINQLVVWFCAGLCEWLKCLSIFLIPSQSFSTPLYPRSAMNHRVCPNFILFRCFHPRLTFESLEEIGSVSLRILRVLLGPPSNLVSSILLCWYA